MPVGKDRSAPPAGRLLIDDDGHLLARHTMQLDLAHPPAAAALAGVRIVPFAHSGEQLAPSWMAAYPPGHLDFRPGEDALPGALERWTP